MTPNDKQGKSGYATIKVPQAKLEQQQWINYLRL